MRVYTIPDCSYCNELKSLLNNDNIPFTEINVELPENEKEFIELTKISESEVVPLVKLGNKLLVPNKTFHTINDGYLLIKKLLSE